jgi:hypothetical protein
MPVPILAGAILIRKHDARSDAGWSHPKVARLVACVTNQYSGIVQDRALPE